MTANIFISTLSRFKMHQSINQIAQESKKELNVAIFKNFSLRVDEILQKYELLEKKYLRSKHTEHALEWKQEEKKLLLCFLLAFCHLYFKKVSEITENEWIAISEAFHGKNVLLMRYEAKSIERNCQRVHWDEKEELLLQKHIKNGMLGKWADISRCIFFESEGEYYKTPKQCRQHWFNHMNKFIKHGQWEVEQDLAILQSALDYGHKWARVVDLLDGKRTEHMIKNRFHSLLTSCSKIIENQTQTKNETKLIKFLINELQKTTQSSIRYHQVQHIDCHKKQNDGRDLRSMQSNVDINQQQKMKTFPSKANSNEAKSLKIEGSSLTINAKKGKKSEENNEAINTTLSRQTNNTYPIYFNYQLTNNFITSPFVPPLVYSPYFSGLSIVYQF